MRVRHYGRFDAITPDDASAPAAPLTLEAANPVARAESALSSAAGLVGAPPPGHTAALVTGAAVGYLLRGVLGAVIGFVLASWATKRSAAGAGGSGSPTGSSGSSPTR